MKLKYNGVRYLKSNKEAYRRRIFIQIKYNFDWLKSSGPQTIRIQ